ncbi:MAG: FAD-dependent oxidoreductase, partial [Nitrososphaerales archaeon]
MAVKSRVIILGAGLTCLAAAWKLTKEGFKVSVVEAQKRLGGLAASFKWHGFWLDLGPHKLYPQKKELEHFLLTVFKDKL